MTKTITFADFNSSEAQETSKLLDYYEDNQLKYVRQLLKDKREDHYANPAFMPNTRNIVKSIIDKSGLLFNRPPALAIFKPGSTQGITDATFNSVMDRADWLETFQNVDVYVRLLKTVVVLQQKYIPQERQTIGGSYRFDENAGDALILTILHQGNSVVRTDITGKRIIELAYLTSAYSQTEPWSYRYISSDVIEDYEVQGEKEKVVKSVVNTDGIVPANPFYDVRQPRDLTGFWFNTPEDLLSFQDNLNLFLCDMQYAIAMQPNKPIFTDRDIESTSAGAQNPRIPYAPPGHTGAGEKWDQIVQAPVKSIGGLGSIVKLEPGMTGTQPYVEFKGPDTNLKQLYDIVAAQARDLASDWAVTVRAEGGMKANSGFQVIVEEMDNLALREQRAQSFQAGLRRFYDITQTLYPEMTDGILMAEFAKPSLPVNALEEEQVWTYRIASGAYWQLDRLLADGYTEQDAIAKLKRDMELRKQLGIPEPTQATAASVNPSNVQQRGGNPRNPENG